MIEDHIPLNAIAPLDSARQSAIANAISDKFLFIQFIPITGVPPDIWLKSKEVGMVRALLGSRLLDIVGDGKGLNGPNTASWASLIRLAGKTATAVAKEKNPLATLLPKHLKN